MLQAEISQMAHALVKIACPQNEALLIDFDRKSSEPWPKSPCKTTMFFFCVAFPRCNLLPVICLLETVAVVFAATSSTKSSHP